ncbi:MAG: alpha-amylase family glycosyl hydrolase [Candidatus Methylopumilus sp.]|jgi:glycosidase
MSTISHFSMPHSQSKPSAIVNRLKPHPHLYQINTWAWLDTLSAQAGHQIKLADVPDAEWDHIQSLGFDIVYLMGIWQRSHAGRHIFRTDAHAFKGFDHALPGWTIANVVGSPFSISDYQPDAHIASCEQLDAVRAKLHARGMRLILDFVPNHTGPDHHWIESHPEYFLRGTEDDFHRDPSAYHLIEPTDAAPYYVARGRDPYFAPWADTAQLDFYNMDTRAALIGVLRTIAKHCDGLRCDMAMLVLNEIFGKTWQHLLLHRPCPATHFWQDAIAALPANFIWMAEVYWDMEHQLQDLGFNYTYDKRLYDRLCHSPAREVRAHLTADVAYQGRMARFLENHDEPRSAAVFGLHTLTAFAALIATLPGLRFFHQGQFEGKAIHLPMPLNAAAQETPDAALLNMYEKVLHIASDEVFHEGAWQLLDVLPDTDGSHADLIAYRWLSSTGYRLVVVNLSAAVSQGRIFIAEELPQASRYAFDDLLNDEQYLREQDDVRAHGLYVRLDAYSAHIFSVGVC